MVPETQAAAEAHEKHRDDYRHVPHPEEPPEPEWEQQVLNVDPLLVLEAEHAIPVHNAYVCLTNEMVEPRERREITHKRIPRQVELFQALRFVN